MICNCNIDFDKYFCDMPPDWREGFVKALCYVYSDNCENPYCDGVKKCETNTLLGDFQVQGTTVSTFYRSEKNTRQLSFDVIDLIDNALNNVDPSCLASIEDWAAMSNQERLQLIFSGQCECCSTTTTSSTTTTTTVAPTTTTTSTTTSSTTTTSSSTTSTTSHPVADFIVTNPQSHGKVSAVSPTFFSIVSGAFPIGQGEELIGKHGGFSGVISLTISNFVFGSFYAHLLRDGVEVECITCSGNGTFAFASHTFLNTEEIRISVTLTPC